MQIFGEEVSSKTIIISGIASVITSLAAMYIFSKYIAPRIAEKAATKAVNDYLEYYGFKQQSVNANDVNLFRER